MVNKNRVKEIIIGLVLISSVFFLVTLILLSTGEKMQINIYEYCCEQLNATYIFYECQCNSLLSVFNGYDVCENLSCGSFCRFDDGELIQTNKIKCEVDSIS